MHFENIESRHRIKIPIGRPDRRGNILSKEAIHNSMWTIMSSPFGAYVDGKFIRLGFVTDYAYIDESDAWIEIEIVTHTYYGCVEEDDTGFKYCDCEYVCLGFGDD